MAGVFKKKKTLFEAKPANPVSVMDVRERAKRLSIREADGGFIVSDDGEYGDKQKVVKGLAALVKCIKEHFSDSENEKSDESEDE